MLFFYRERRGRKEEETSSRCRQECWVRSKKKSRKEEVFDWIKSRLLLSFNDSFHGIFDPVPDSSDFCREQRFHLVSSIHTRSMDIEPRFAQHSWSFNRRVHSMTIETEEDTRILSGRVLLCCLSSWCDQKVDSNVCVFLQREFNHIFSFLQDNFCK